MGDGRKSETTRRRFMAGASGVVAAGFVTLRPAQATPESMTAAIRQVTGEAKVQPGKVKLDVPPPALVATRTVAENNWRLEVTS